MPLGTAPELCSGTTDPSRRAGGVPVPAAPRAPRCDVLNQPSIRLTPVPADRSAEPARCPVAGAGATSLSTVPKVVTERIYSAAAAPAAGRSSSGLWITPGGPQSQLPPWSLSQTSRVPLGAAQARQDRQDRQDSCPRGTPAASSGHLQTAAEATSGQCRHCTGARATTPRELHFECRCMAPVAAGWPVLALRPVILPGAAGLRRDLGFCGCQDTKQGLRRVRHSSLLQVAP